MGAIERDLISLCFSASSPGVAFGDPPLAPKAMEKKGSPSPLGFSVSSAGTLTARLGQHRNSPKRQKRARTSMLLFLGLAESSDASEPIFATGTGRSLG